METKPYPQAMIDELKSIDLNAYAVRVQVLALAQLARQVTIPEEEQEAQIRVWSELLGALKNSAIGDEGLVAGSIRETIKSIERQETRAQKSARRSLDDPDPPKTDKIGPDVVAVYHTDTGPGGETPVATYHIRGGSEKDADLFS